MSLMRRLHPDFHMPPYAADVAAEFDGDAFAAGLEAAHVDSVVVFAKCVYGFCYYRTAVGRRHPGLGERDFFGEAVEACRRRGIEVLAYFHPLVDAAVGEFDQWLHRRRSPVWRLTRWLCWSEGEVQRICAYALSR